MKRGQKITDLIILSVLVAIAGGLPLGIRAYDRHIWPKQIPPEAKVFTLTGNAQRGWLVGEVHAYDMVSLWNTDSPVERPVIRVKKGDLVVFKLRSSDVTHGFSLKAFSVYITEGIKPGKTVFVSFRADRVGEVLFACNAFCGDIHQHMTGTLVVTA